MATKKIEAAHPPQSLRPITGSMSSTPEHEIDSLHVAAALGDLKVVERLLEEGADVNSVDGAGNSALHRAVRAQKAEIVELLLASGAKPNGVLSKSKTPLHHAAEKGNGAIIAMLLKHKADVDAEDDFGWKPLYYAEANGHMSASKQLREAGATDRRALPR